MKNYFSKFKDKISNFKNKNPFTLIISLIVLVFLLLLYFTIPTFYNYKNFEREIQKKILKDFKLNLKNISGVTYLMVPAPHFLIEECDIYFADDPKEKILKAKYLKINIFLKNLHKKEKIELKNIYLNKVDLDLQFVDIKNFYNHLKNNITKPIFIKNGNFFFRNNKDEIVSISKIKNFEYFFNLRNKEKKLNILGNLFGSNFKLNWKKNFSNPYISMSDIQFNNPKINISNKFNKENENYTVASTNIEFLKNNLDLNYKFNKSAIELLDNESKKFNQSKLIGKIALDPFFFDLNLILSGIRIQTVLNNIFINLYNTNRTVDLNFNGNLKINLNEINNRLFENLIINVNFLDEKISLDQLSVNLKKIGKINFSDPLIYEKNQKLIINSKIKFDVVDQEELYRKFLIPRQNRIDLKKVYFELEYNIDDESYFLSNINLSENDNEQKTFYEVKNAQQLNSVISKEFKKINLD
tara:strand:+ start:55 stop:1464 length:1410 start_codon:yes stop_codon:yes gene_type:complete